MIYNFLFCSQAKHVFNLSPNKSFDDVKKLKLIAFLVNQVDKQSRTTKNSHCSESPFLVQKIKTIHIVLNFYFLSKNSTLISRENGRFFGGEKLVKMWFLEFLAVDNFDFTRKIVKKKIW